MNEKKRIHSEAPKKQETNKIFKDKLNRREFLKETALLAGGGIFAGAVPFLRAAGFSSDMMKQKRPNILWLMGDEHSGRVMEQTGYKYVHTPGLNKLANQGVTFTRAYCTYPSCSPSRFSMITGQMPDKLDNNVTSYKSIGKIMKKAGYETAYYGKWGVPHTNMKKDSAWHGFEKYHDHRYHAERIERLTKNFIHQDHSAPFFLVASFNNPHDCTVLARDIGGLRDEHYHDGSVPEHMEVGQCPPLPGNFAIPADEPQGIAMQRNTNPTMHMYRTHPTTYWDTTDWRQYMYGYDRLVEKVDHHILNIINTLENRGLLNNTIIFYTSDHGDGHASHKWNQKNCFYEEVVNVPFIVSWRGHTKPGAIDRKTLVSSGIDLFPTFCKLAGVSPPGSESFYGLDLSPYFLKGQNNSPYKRKYIVTDITTSLEPGGQKKVKGRMIVGERFKYELFNGGKNREQLFDLKKYPGELPPVTKQSQYKNELLRHRHILKDWIKKTDGDFHLHKDLK
jgi:arylsulfatase A-like enzyme